MGTLLESTEACKARAQEVNLSSDEVSLLIAQGTDSLARLALAACPPGQSPTDAQVQLLFPATHVSLAKGLQVL